MNALEEEQYAIAHAATARDESGRITEEFAEVRKERQADARAHVKTSTTSKSRPTSHSRLQLAHSVRRERRRQPRAHGFEHAEAGRAARRP